MCIIAVFPRCHTGDLLKRFVEISGIVVTALDCNIQHIVCVASGKKKLGGFVNSFGTYVVPERHFIYLLKKCGKNRTFFRKNPIVKGDKLCYNTNKYCQMTETLCFIGINACHNLYKGECQRCLKLKELK